MMGDLLNRLKNLMKSGQGQSFDDSGDTQIGESNWLGRTLQTVESIVPYGTFGTPMAKVRQILFSLRGNESNIAALNSDSTNRIKKDTKPGEYGIGSPLTGANIYFKENGDAVIEIPKENFIVNAVKNIDLNGEEIHLNGDSKRLVTFSELDSGLQNMIGQINSHIHLTTATVGATAVPGVIGAPTVPMSVDIDPSETQTIKTGG